MNHDDNILKSMTKMTLQIKNFDKKVLMIKLKEFFYADDRNFDKQY